VTKGHKNYFYKELLSTLERTELWLFMAWIDIVLRYRRTKLGPFWLVIVSFISIVCIATLGSLLFKVKFGSFFPYVTCGMVVWAYIAAMITDSCVVFISQTGIIKHVNVPLISFGLRMFVRNTIIFLHSLLIVALVLLYFQVNIGWNILMIIPGFAIFAVAALSLSIVVGFICTRFRDVMQLINSLIGILAFLTPVMWQPDMLGDKAYLTNLNPFTHYVALLREPLLGRVPEAISLIFTVIFSLILLICASFLFNKYRKQLVHWL
jgi:lipopolysaccharide transport system permease protein